MNNSGFLSKPIFVFLTPVLPVIQLYSVNFHRLTITHVLFAAAVFLAGVLIIRTLINVVSKAKQRNDIILTLTVIALFYGQLFAIVQDYRFIWLAVFSVLIAVVIWRKNVRQNFGRGLNIMMLTLLVIPLTSFAKFGIWQNRSTIEANIKASFPEIARPAAIPPKANRDFYYIVMDRYARVDQLARVYGYDNTPFLKQLKQRGFNVSPASFSNYQRTAHSLASSLNLDYLNRLDQPPGDTSFDWLPLYNMLRQSRLVQFMKSSGFEINTYGSWWEPTRVNPLSDKDFNYKAWPEIIRILFKNSFLSSGLEWAGVKQLNSLWLQCKRPGKKFQAMILNSKSAKRKFVFAHFLVPHPPFVIDEKGNCMSIKKAKSRTRAQNYIGQLKYANSQLLKLIDELQATKGAKPVIVIQADEGPWPEKYAGNEIESLGADVSNADWLKVNRDDLREKMAILNAQYLPGITTGKTKPDTTPVNTFRKILREYFDVKLKQLPDRNYIFESNAKLYKFHDVTGKLAGETE